MTLTIGFSEYQPGMALDDCIKVADTALYQGKQSGKNRIEAQRGDSRETVAQEIRLNAPWPGLQPRPE